MCITISIMLEKLRVFLVVLEEGSLRRAADRLRISQSAITRQMQALELDLGGRVLERTSAGVRPTNGGHAIAERAKTLLADYDSTMAEVRRLVRGESERLRIGYIASAVQEYLGPALAVLRRAYPRLNVKMLDQTPGEMIIAIAGAGATWDLFVVWQRSKIASPLRTLLSELNLKSQ
jgi:DNA-binding transcriptional LysR family regulator